MMRAEIDTLLSRHLVRKTKKQKAAFAGWMTPLLEQNGYTVSAEKGTFGATNIVAGNPETAKILLTAHYDTPAALPFPNFITPGNIPLYILFQLLIVVLFIGAPLLLALPVFFLTDNFLISYFLWLVLMFGMLVLMMAGPANKNNFNDNSSGVATLLETALALPDDRKNDVCFVFFDLEELGLVGSRSFIQSHPAAAGKPLFNFDCVGDGDHILFLLPKNLRKTGAFAGVLAAAFPDFEEGGLHFSIPERGMFYPSDQFGFKNGIGVAAFRRNRFAGYYIGRIHTARDTILQSRNIEALRDVMHQIVEHFPAV